MLVAGKEPGEDVTNGAAACPVVAAWKVRPREEGDRGKEARNRDDEPEGGGDLDQGQW
jgi:hypothetical protein